MLNLREYQKEALKHFYGYIITNMITSKIYVGITSRDVKTRWREHRCRAKKNKNYYLYNAMNKYGANNFYVKEIIRTKSWNTICSWEITTIKNKNSFAPNGYNLTLGGDGRYGLKHTKECKDIISIKSKKMWMQTGFREEHIEKAKKRCSSIDIRKQLSKQSAEYFSSYSARKQMSESKKRFYKQHPEILKEMSERAKRQHKDPEFIKKMKANPVNAIPVKCSSMFFRSTCEAAKYLQVNKKTIAYRIKHIVTGYEKLIKGQEYNWEIKCN